MNRLALGLLSLGHFTVDLCQGGLPVLLPFLYVDLGLTYALSALVVTVLNLTSSVVQPIFGYYADRLSGRWILPVSCAVAVAGLALAAAAPSYPALLLLVVVSGLGIAMYHPDAARLANAAAGARKASGMSFFAVGGNLGFASGPAMLGTLLALFGRPGANGLWVIALAVPALFVVLAARLPRPAGKRAGASAGTGTAAVRGDARRPMAFVVAVLSCRQWASASLNTFIPLYVVNYLGEPFTRSNELLGALFLGTVAGTLAGGQLADRFGRKPVITGSLLATTPLLLLWLNTGGMVAIAVLFLAGSALVMTLYPTVVVAQELMPERTALAAGLTLGLSVGVGGLGSAALGLVADSVGIAPTLVGVACIPLLGAALSLPLPDTLHRATATAA